MLKIEDKLYNTRNGTSGTPNLIEVDFAGVAKRDILRLLLAAVVANMPAASPVKRGHSIQSRVNISLLYRNLRSYVQDNEQ